MKLSEKLKTMTFGACPEIGNHASFPLPDDIIQEIEALEDKAAKCDFNYDEIKDRCQKARQELSNDLETLKMDTKQFKCHIYELLESNELLLKSLE
jgi:hypothetical protein